MKDIRSEPIYELIDHDGLFDGIKIHVNAFQFNGISKHPFGDRLEKYVKKHTVRIKSKEKYCDQCGLAFFEHGAICIAKDQNEEIWSKVCPGDWIIISDHDYWPCPNYLFKKTYKMIREGI